MTASSEARRTPRHLRPTLLLCTTLVAPAAFGAGAHVHGQGQLDIAVDDGRVELMLTAPLSDLDSGTDGSDEALAARFGVAELFVFADARCTLEGSTVAVAQDEEDYFEETSTHEEDHEDHKGGHEEHGGDHHDAAGHGHDDNHHHDDDHHDVAGHDDDDHHDDGHHEVDHHDDGAHHDNEDEEDHSGHKDLRLTWVYRCSEDPRGVDVALFDVTQLETIKVQAVGASGATAASLTSSERVVALP